MEQYIFFFAFTAVNVWIAYNLSYLKKDAAIEAKMDSLEKTVKAKLFTESKVTFQSLSRDATINYFEKYLCWVNYLVQIDIQTVKKDQFVQKCEQFETDFFNAQSRFMLFCEDFDKDYGQLTLDLTQGLMKIQFGIEAKLDQYLSIDLNVHLKPKIVQEFFDLRRNDYNALIPKISKFTSKLRKLITEQITMG